MKHQSLFVLSLIMLLSVVFTGCVAVLPEVAESEAAAPAPEEMQSVTGSEAVADSSFYAANPELMVAGRHENIGDYESGTEIAFYAANPELMIADRYAAAQEEKLRLQRICFPGR